MVGVSVVDDGLDMAFRGWGAIIGVESRDERLQQMRLKEYQFGFGGEERVFEAFCAESIVCCDDGHGLGHRSVGEGEPVLAFSLSVTLCVVLTTITTQAKRNIPRRSEEMDFMFSGFEA